MSDPTCFGDDDRPVRHETCRSWHITTLLSC